MLLPWASGKPEGKRGGTNPKRARRACLGMSLIKSCRDSADSQVMVLLHLVAAMLGLRDQGLKTNPWNNRKEGLMSEGFELRGSQVLWKFRVQASGVDDFGIVKAFIALNFEQ